MSYVDRVQKSIEFIERNLRNKIALDSVARAASFSPYHFHRIFTLTVGESIKHYVRKRRLTEAAYELRDSDRKIIEIAIDYQFESQESFGRAFKKLFLETPGRYRNLVKFPKFYEKKKLTEESVMHQAQGIEIGPEIVHKESFWVVGLEYRGSKEHHDEIPNLWKKLDSRMSEVESRLGNEALGVCFASSTMIQNDEISYVAGVPVSEHSRVPLGMVAIKVEGGDFVLVTHKGAIHNISTTIDFIYGSWLPRSSYDPDDRADLEIYDERFKLDEDDSEFDILVPIKKSP